MPSRFMLDYQYNFGYLFSLAIPNASFGQSNLEKIQKGD
jgi:hypothetical protein